MSAVKILVILTLAFAQTAHAEIDLLAVRAARAAVQTETEKRHLLAQQSLRDLISEISVIESELQLAQIKAQSDTNIRHITVAVTAGLMAAPGLVTFKFFKGKAGFTGRYVQWLVVRSGIWIAGSTDILKDVGQPGYAILIRPSEIPRLQIQLTKARVTLEYRLQVLGDHK